MLPHIHSLKNCLSNMFFFSYFGTCRYIGLLRRMLVTNITSNADKLLDIKGNVLTMHRVSGSVLFLQGIKVNTFLQKIISSTSRMKSTTCLYTRKFHIELRLKNQNELNIYTRQLIFYKDLNLFCMGFKYFFKCTHLGQDWMNDTKLNYNNATCRRSLLVERIIREKSW